MGAPVKELELGCYTIRGPDTETALIGPITAQIIDADRLVRLEFKNGFPNWMMYRTALAGDSVYLPKLKQWVIAFTWVVCQEGAVKRHVLTEEFVGCVAIDALNILIFGRELQPYTVTAKSLGVHRDTYRRVRDGIFARLKVSLDEYWVQLVAACYQLRINEINAIRNAERKRTSNKRGVS